mgnify:CR=1 FL=1
MMLHTGAYWLMWSLRRLMPVRSSWRVAQFDTLRYRLDSSATVPSSRTAANATFALNATLGFLRVFAICSPWPIGRFRGRTLS